jgi:hypothetical protein
MCYDRYTRRRREEAESRGIWQDFDRTTPISEPESPEVAEPEVAEPEVTEPERAEQAIASER